MPDFKFKEVKLLRNDVQNKFSVIKKTAKREAELIETIKGKITSFGFGKKFVNYVSDYLKGNKEQSFDDNKLAEELKKLVDELIYISPKSSECSKYLKKNQSDIDTYLVAVKPATSALRWFFAYSFNKEAASKSYAQLKLLNEEETFNHLFKDSEQYHQKKNVVFEKNDLKTYKETLLNIARKELSESIYEISIERLFEQFKVIDTMIATADLAISQRKEMVKRAVDYYLDNYNLEILKTIPIEKLNSQRNGFRLKPLKDSGIDNFYTLLKTPLSKLSNIKYVSAEAAYKMLEIARKYSLEAKKTVRIRLSADKRDAYSTALVKQVYRLRKMYEDRKEITRVKNENSEWINAAMEEVRTLGNGVLWPFISDSEKESFLSSYNFLNEIIKSDYRKDITAKASSIKTNYTISEINAWNDFTNNSIDYFNIIEKLCPNSLGQGQQSVYGLPDFLASEIESEPIYTNGLLCSLRKYQEWGVKYILHQKRSLLGDEMGLGKTIQAIASMVSLKNQGATHFLVICPASVLTNWYREIIKHSVLNPIRVQGSYGRYFANKWKKNGGVAIVTYESSHLIQPDPGSKIDMVVADEAHYVKNPEAKRSMHVKRLCSYANNILFMTGTALENKPEEMVELISILRPELAPKIAQLTFMSAAPKFRELVAPVYYRRKREDVLSELPELLEEEEWCSLSSEEEQLYANSVFSRNFMSVRRVSWNVSDLKKSSKANRMFELIEQAKEENRKVLVFSYFLDTLEKIKKALGDRATSIINGSVPAAKRQEIIDEFDKSPAGTVLPAQIVSGGTGLNIQSASVVIICEPQFKPSIENQAISRAYRMGQARNVMVFRLLCENTVDEHIVDILQNKQTIFNEFADKSKANEGIIEINDSTIGEIVKSEEQRLREKGYTMKDETSPVNETESSQKEQEIDYRDYLSKSYNQLVSLFIDKYGAAKYDYFIDSSCSTKNPKITRSKEGLFCHHIDEDKGIKLSDPYFAKQFPFDYQKADRLVYCDILEHLILHIKIAEEKNDSKYDVGIGGAICFICPQINTYLRGRAHRYEYEIKSQYIVQSHFNEYIEILKYLINIIKTKYPRQAPGLLQFLYIDSDERAVSVVYDKLKQLI